jgi:hypothetical protein
MLNDELIPTIGELFLSEDIRSASSFHHNIGQLSIRFVLQAIGSNYAVLILSTIIPIMHRPTLAKRT